MQHTWYRQKAGVIFITATKRFTNISVAEWESTTNIIAIEPQNKTCIIAADVGICITAIARKCQLHSPTETATCRIDYRNLKQNSFIITFIT